MNQSDYIRLLAKELEELKGKAEDVNSFSPHNLFYNNLKRLKKKLTTVIAISVILQYSLGPISIHEIDAEVKRLRNLK
jgi:hypothetical protein